MEPENFSYITFTLMDPTKIGNSLHCYEVRYKGNLIGKIDFDAPPDNPLTPHITMEIVVGELSGRKVQLNLTYEMMSEMKTNAEIFDALRPFIHNLIQTEVIPKDVFRVSIDS